MSAGAGIQPHVVRGQNSGACGRAFLLATALVPGHPGSRAGGHAVHHHHLHPEVKLSDSCSRRWEQPLYGLLVYWWTISCRLTSAVVNYISRNPS